MTYIQCFVLYLREEGPRAVAALYFGWPAFRNSHFVIGGGGGAGGGGGIIFISAVHVKLGWPHEVPISSATHGAQSGTLSARVRSD